MMKLSEKENRILKDLVATLRSEFGASEILLYGSAARGQLEEGSDIDLFVVLPEVTWEIEKRVIDRCFLAGLECDRVISTACFTRTELTDTPLRASPFVLNVRREGIPL